MAHVIIRMENLPLTANARDIRDFFAGLQIPDGGVKIIGGEKGEVFIVFSETDASRAFLLNNANLKGQPVRLFMSSKDEMDRVFNMNRARFLAQAQAQQQQQQQQQLLLQQQQQQQQQQQLAVAALMNPATVTNLLLDQQKREQIERLVHMQLIKEKEQQQNQQQQLLQMLRNQMLVQQSQQQKQQQPQQQQQQQSQLAAATTANDPRGLSGYAQQADRSKPSTSAATETSGKRRSRSRSFSPEKRPRRRRRGGQRHRRRSRRRSFSRSHSSRSRSRTRSRSQSRSRSPRHYNGRNGRFSRTNRARDNRRSRSRSRSRKSPEYRSIYGLNGKTTGNTSSTSTSTSLNTSDIWDRSPITSIASSNKQNLMRVINSSGGGGGGGVKESTSTSKKTNKVGDNDVTISNSETDNRCLKVYPVFSPKQVIIKFFDTLTLTESQIKYEKNQMNQMTGIVFVQCATYTEKKRALCYHKRPLDGCPVQVHHFDDVEFEKRPANDFEEPRKQQTSDNSGFGPVNVASAAASSSVPFNYSVYNSRIVYIEKLPTFIHKSELIDLFGGANFVSEIYFVHKTDDTGLSKAVCFLRIDTDIEKLEEKLREKTYRNSNRQIKITAPNSRLNTNCLILYNIPWNITVDRLRAFIETSDQRPQRIHLLLNRHNSCSGRVYIEFESYEKATIAQAFLNRKLIEVPAHAQHPNPAPPHSVFALFVSEREMKADLRSKSNASLLPFMRHGRGFLPLFPETYAEQGGGGGGASGAGTGSYTFHGHEMPLRPLVPFPVPLMQLPVPMAGGSAARPMNVWRK